jgi:hypothetical protein
VTKRIFWLTPSYSGMRLSTVKNVLETRELLVGSGYKFQFDGIEHMPLDVARNEIAGMFLRSKCDVALLMDDDGTVDSSWIAKVLPLIDRYPVLSFPQLLRPKFDRYNVMLADEKICERGIRLQRCILTGLGAVLLAREVVQKMADAAPMYDSVDPNLPSPMIFSSMIVAKERIPFLDGKGVTPFTIATDDIVFSLQCQSPIYAVVDAVTTHGGYRGCLGEQLDRQGVTR